jgi:hypothetical protein
MSRPGSEPCPHCPDGHQDPRRVPWCAYVGPERDSDGQPMHIRVERTQGSHVADSDANWLWNLIRTYRDADLVPPVPAPITAEDVRTAGRAWRGRSAGVTETDRAAFVAEWLNRRGG